MDIRWIYAQDGAQKGPVSRDDLRLALSRGEVDRHSLVWCEGMPQWQALESVEGLQPLLEQVPPPLPHQPPPEADRPGKVKTALAGKLDKSVDWLGNKIGDALWKRFLSRPVVYGLISSLMVVGGGYASTYLLLKEPTVPTATGQVRIDANPWGEIQWIRGPDGSNVDLPEARTTPFLMTLPVGNYQAQVDYPHAQSSERCDLRVQPDHLAVCWFDLAPVLTKSYFEKIGW